MSREELHHSHVGPADNDNHIVGVIGFKDWFILKIGPNNIALLLNVDM